jgi:dienelactone hydrolase
VDACTLKAYVAEPAAAESSPAVIVVQEWSERPHPGRRTATRA